MENLRKKEPTQEFWKSAIPLGAPFAAKTSSLTIFRANRRSTNISIGAHADHDPGHKDVQGQIAQKYSGDPSKAAFHCVLEVDS